mmetsp:Transcript_14492/g.43808  ORF Transcript_14492/g.43808 Transcript_14492/m.43808 type:complete len:346 (+) Transcript_14492:3659-4696(+)
MQPRVGKVQLAYCPSCIQVDRLDPLFEMRHEHIGLAEVLIGGHRRLAACCGLAPCTAACPRGQLADGSGYFVVFRALLSFRRAMPPHMLHPKTLWWCPKMLLAVPMAGLVVVEVRQSQPGVLPPRPPVRQRLEHRSSVISAGGLPIVAARQAGSIEAVIVLRNDLLRQRCCIPVEVLALMLPPNRAGSTFPRVVREVAADIHALGGIRKLLEALVVCRTPPLPLRMLYLYLLIERVRIVQRRTDGRVGGDVAQVGGHSHNNEAAVALVHRVVGDVDGHLAHCCVMRHLLPNASVPEQLQVVVKAQNMPAMCDHHHHLFVKRPHELAARRGVNCASSNGGSLGGAP